MWSQETADPFHEPPSPTCDSRCHQLTRPPSTRRHHRNSFWEVGISCAVAAGRGPALGAPALFRGQRRCGAIGDSRSCAGAAWMLKLVWPQSSPGGDAGRSPKSRNVWGSSKRAPVTGGGGPVTACDVPWATRRVAGRSSLDRALERASARASERWSQVWGALLGGLPLPLNYMLWALRPNVP